MPELTKCKWHLCETGPGQTRARFIPLRSDQEFCCASCRIARATWRQTRGSVLVDLVLEGKWLQLRKAREELKRETK